MSDYYLLDKKKNPLSIYPKIEDFCWTYEVMMKENREEVITES